MKHSSAFLSFALALIYLAMTRGGTSVLLLWPALSFVVAAVAYAGAGPRLFGKRACGTIAPIPLLVMLPYLGLSWLLWYVQRPFARCASACEVAPGLWLARRLRPGELPADVRVIVDLTAEFWESRAVRQGRRYVCVPTLDSSSSPEDGFREVLATVLSAREPVLIHCAQGRGRSAALAAAVLIRRGMARDVADAERQLVRRRAGVRLNDAQRDLVRRVTANSQAKIGV